MDSEEPPNVRVACSGDIDEVVRLMHDAAAWMSAKGTPAWDVARIDRTFAETFGKQSAKPRVSTPTGKDDITYKLLRYKLAASMGTTHIIGMLRCGIIFAKKSRPCAI